MQQFCIYISWPQGLLGAYGKVLQIKLGISNKPRGGPSW